MIKTLQKKFVITAMTAISVLLLVLLGAINLVNFVLVGKQTDRTLTMISDNRGVYGNKPPMNPHPGPPSAIAPRDDHDTFMASTFFVVHLSTDGTVLETDLSRIASITENDAEQLALEVHEKQQFTGKVDKYKYQIRSLPGGPGYLIFFLDTSDPIYASIRVIFLSAVIGLMCWFMMLGLVVFLSKRAIRPIAENIERQKQFVTNAGHEIKTPLAIILANTEAMELYNGENKWSRNIREQTHRLSDLMKNLLLLARMDEGAAEVTTSDFSLSALLEESTAFYCEPMGLKQINSEIVIQPGIQIHANRENILQLVSILLDNALKYTNDGGQIAVVLRKGEKHVYLQVRNTCQAIPDTPPDKLFDRFYRGNEARTQKSGGYGIGLSVAQAIVKANKGSIRAEYQQPDWVSFTVTL